MTNSSIDAVIVPAREAPQGCLKIFALTVARLLVHFLAMLLVVWALLSAVRVFLVYFEEEDAKLPAISVLIVNFSYRLRFHGYVILPFLFFIDACALLLLQLLPRPWRFLSRVWFSGVLFGAILLLVMSLFGMALPLDILLPPEKRVIARKERVEDVLPANEENREPFTAAEALPVRVRLRTGRGASPCRRSR